LIVVNLLALCRQGGRLSVKRVNLVKRIFELNQFYEEASDQEIDAFCEHDSLLVGDVAAFKAVADQPIRKMIHAISKTNVLDNYSVDDIAAKAASLGLKIETKEGKIVVPSDRKAMKNMFRFLDDGIYEASLSSNRYITNSKRPFGAAGSM
jgi:hypothetical protein